MRSLFSTLSVAMLASSLMAPALAQGIGDPSAPPPPPPPPPSAESAEWYAALAGKTEGPFTLTTLREMARAGQIRPDDQVYSQRTGWKPAREIAELQGYIVAAPPPPSPPPGPPPPPAGNTQRDLDAKIMAYFVGTWRIETTIHQAGTSADVVVEVTYRPDGSFAGYQSLQFPGYAGYQPPASVTNISGRYELTAMDERNFTLTMRAVGSQASSAKLTIIDQDTMQNADGTTPRRVR